MNNSMTGKMLVIGDAHFKDSMAYSDYVDRREEKKNILNFIVEQSQDCHTVIFMGDNLDKPNNTSETIRSFIQFVERFHDKKLIFLVGNHEKKGNGQSALDFMKEIRKDNWEVISTPKTLGTFTFLPYMSKVELGVSTDEEATKIVVDEHLKGGDILFAHHAISDTFANIGNMSVNDFHEIILPKEILESRYKKTFAGHIHHPQEHGDVIITGSLFTDTVNELEKYIWKIDLENLDVEKILVPGRKIYGFKLFGNNYKKVIARDLDKNSIVKVTISDKEIPFEIIKEWVDQFDGSIIIEQYPNERSKIHFDSSGFEIDLDTLIDLYAKAKDVDFHVLKEGIEIIKDY